MSIWMFFRGMEWWMISIVLALFGLGFSIPLRSTLVFSATIRPMKPVYYFVIGPVAEEIILRLVILTYLLMYFEPMTAILITTVIYMLYGFVLYGTYSIGDTFIIGLLFSFAFLEFGLIVVLLAHLIYRVVDIIR